LSWLNHSLLVWRFANHNEQKKYNSEADHDSNNSHVNQDRD
jgi:hypothetical protein